MSKSAAAAAWTPANTVTVIRIIGVPFLVLAMLAPWDGLFGNAQLAASIKPWVCAVLFLLLSFSDFLDGYLARSRNEVTTFGKFMDPLADKVLVVSAMICLLVNKPELLPAWALIIILAREFIISGFRLVASDAGIVIAASMWGKVKTVSQMVMVIMMLIDINNPVYILLTKIVMYVAVILTVVSLVDYIYKNKEVLGD